MYSKTYFHTSIWYIPTNHECCNFLFYSHYGRQWMPIFTNLLSVKFFWTSSCTILLEIPYHAFHWVMIWSIHFSDIFWYVMFPHNSPKFEVLYQLFGCPIHCKGIRRSIILNNMLYWFITIDFLVDGIPIHRAIL